MRRRVTFRTVGSVSPVPTHSQYPSGTENSFPWYRTMHRALRYRKRPPLAPNKLSELHGTKTAASMHGTLSPNRVSQNPHAKQFTYENSSALYDNVKNILIPSLDLHPNSRLRRRCPRLQTLYDISDDSFSITIVYRRYKRLHFFTSLLKIQFLKHKRLCQRNIVLKKINGLQRCKLAKIDQFKNISRKLNHNDILICSNSRIITTPLSKPTDLNLLNSHTSIKNNPATYTESPQTQFT